MIPAQLYEVTVAGPRKIKVVVPDSSGENVVKASRLAFERSKEDGGQPSWAAPATDALTGVVWVCEVFIDPACFASP